MEFCVPSIPAYRCLITYFALVICPALWGQAIVNEALATNLRYVDQSSSSPTEDGSLVHPWKTVGQAIDWLDANRSLHAKVHIAAGTYREGGFTLSDRTGLTILEGAAPGTVIISGSEVWTGWINDGSGNWYKSWTNTWPLTPETNPTDNIVEPEQGRRTEMVFVNGVLQRQVTSFGQLADGTYFVDEAADRLYLRPMWGIDPADAEVEVAVEKNLLSCLWLQGLVLRNLVFEHAAAGGTSYPGRSTLFLVGAVDNGNEENDPSDRAFLEDVLIDQVQSRWNNSGGMTIANVKRMTIRDSQFIHNGNAGIGGNRVQSLFIENSDFSFNNWRSGLLGGVYGWAPAGIKLLHVDSIEVANSRFTGNYTVGLWFDTGSTNLSVRKTLITHNWNTGLYHEANPGLLSGSWLLLRDNGHFPPQGIRGGGVLFAESASISISNSYLINNSYYGLSYRLRERPSKAYWNPVNTFDGYSVASTVFNDNVVTAIRNLGKPVWSGSSARENGNAIASLSDTNNNGYYASNGVPSFSGDHNRYYSPFTSEIFSEAVTTGFGWIEDDLAYWQTETGDEANSAWDPNWEDSVFWDAFGEEDGVLIIEAEDTHVNAQRSDTVAWTFGHGFESDGYPEYGGWGYLRTENGGHANGTHTDSARLVYRILITSPGTYHLAVRRYAPTGSDDSVHVRLNDAPVGDTSILEGTSTRWEWKHAATSLGHLEAGLHTLELVRHEDGLCIDRLMIANQVSRLPLNGSTAIGGDATLLEPPPESYITWTQSHGLEGPDAVITADLEPDGLGNLLEYALDTAPGDAGSGPDQLPVITKTGTALHYSFTMGKGSEAVDYLIEFSNDLSDWTTPSPHPVSGSSSDLIQVSLPGSATGQPVFGRLNLHLLD